MSKTHFLSKKVKMGIIGNTKIFLKTLQWNLADRSEVFCFMFTKALSVKILKVIDERKLTLESVSEAAGLSRKFVGNIVSGKQVPTLDSFEKICSALQLEPNDLLLSEKSKTLGRSEPMSVNKIFCKEEENRRLLVPVCPHCNSLLTAELQNYCDSCGQRLRWDKYNRSDITFEKPRKL